MTESDPRPTQEPEIRRPIIKESLTPVLLCLRMFGMSHDNAFERKGMKKLVQILLKAYNYFLVLVLAGTIVKSAAVLALFKGFDKDELYIFLAITAYNLKCVVQRISCLFMTCAKKEHNLFSLIKRMQTFLNDIKDAKGCKKEERCFKFKMTMWLLVFFAVLFSITGVNIALVFQPITSLEIVMKATLAPIPYTQTAMFVSTVVSLWGNASWLLPVAVCNVLTQALSYIFSEFYRNLKRQKQEGVNLRSNIKDIRGKYVALTTMCSDLDDMLSWIFMVSYLTDIVVICLMLRTAVIDVSDIYGRLIILFWMFPSVFSLITLSHYSSNLADKGEEMRGFIQELDATNIDMEEKFEVDLLMFHLNSQPVVLTIWKMIPLYKSIIISIFVCIVSYFTMMISF